MFTSNDGAGSSRSVAAVGHAAPTQVSIGMHVVELRSVDARAQSFYADLYLWMRFNKNGLDEERIKDLIDRLEPVNGKFRIEKTRPTTRRSVTSATSATA